MSEDPFTSVKVDVEQQIEEVDELYADWRALIGATSARDRELFSRHTDEIKTGVRSIEWDLKVMDEAVGIVERNRHKFHFIDDDELATRKDFVAETRNNIARIKKHLNDPSVWSKVHDQQRGMLMNHGGKSAVGGQGQNRYARLEEAMKAENADFIQAQQQEQRVIESQQDKYLDQLIHSGATLELMAEDIYNTLNVHSEMLDTMETEIETTDSRLRAAVRRVENVIDKTSNGVGCAVICFLVLVLIGVIVMVIYI